MTESSVAFRPPMKSPLAALVGLLLLLTAGPSANSFAADSLPEQRQTLKVNGDERSYLIRGPQRRPAGNDKRALVIVLHGGGGNAESAETMSGFTSRAREHGFYVVYPDGSSRLKNKLQTWNAVHCCGYAMDNDVDDPAFFRKLIDDLIDRYPIDRKRVYVTGMSNGGMMAHRLGIELADRIAAIAPVVGTVFGDEKLPSAPVSALIINGGKDESVPINGGESRGRGAKAWDAPAAPGIEQTRFWARANRCDSEPIRKDSAEIQQLSYRCPKGLAVEWYVVMDGGHAWPGGVRGSRRGDDPGDTLDATDLIWAFFRDHPKLD